MSVKKTISTTDQYSFFSYNNTKIKMDTAILTLKNSLMTTILSTYDNNEIPNTERLSEKTRNILKNEIYNEFISPSKDKKTIKKSEIFKKALETQREMPNKNISTLKLKPKLTKDNIFKKLDIPICELCNFNDEEEEKEKEINSKMNKFYSGLKYSNNKHISYYSKDIDMHFQKKESMMLKNKENDQEKKNLLTLSTLSISFGNKNNEYNKTLSLSRNIKTDPYPSYQNDYLKEKKPSILKNKDINIPIIQNKKQKKISPIPSSIPILETNTKLNNFLFKNFTFEKDMTRIYNIVSIKDKFKIGKTSKKGNITFNTNTKSNKKKFFSIEKKEEDKNEKSQNLKSKINFIIDSIEADRTISFDKNYKSLYDYEERKGLEYYNKDQLKRVMNIKKYFKKLRDKNTIFDYDFDFDLIKKKKNEIYQLEEDSFGIRKVIPKYMKKRFKIQTNLKYNYYNGVMFGEKSN